jgi:hypothetical protein
MSVLGERVTVNTSQKYWGGGFVKREGIIIKSILPLGITIRDGQGELFVHRKNIAGESCQRVGI